MNPRRQDLLRIDAALTQAAVVLSAFVAGCTAARFKAGGEPVTAADLAVDRALAAALLSSGEGWLSEETVDDDARLCCRRVWVVDPLDGTQQFIAGVPEYSVSIGLVEDGRAVAGGVLNPATHQRVVGAVGRGVWLNGAPCGVREANALEGATVLASRSESSRGEWRRWDHESFSVRPMGSVAWKLALVAAGIADATWSRVAKHEWDVAAGVALVAAGGGNIVSVDGSPLRFNQPDPRVPGLIASAPGLTDAIRALLGATDAA